MTGLEPATSTLARWRSTRWATSANLVPPGGIEPPTQGFSVPCSTDWATEAKVATRNGLEPSTSSVTGWRSNQLNYRAISGGNNRARTYDPLLVRQMLSQLSYAPISTTFVFCLTLYLSDLIIIHYSEWFVNSFLKKFFVSVQKRKVMSEVWSVECWELKVESWNMRSKFNVNFGF